MPHQRDRDNTVDDIPMAGTQAQQSAYTSASEFDDVDYASQTRTPGRGGGRMAGDRQEKMNQTARQTAEKVQQTAEQGKERAAEGMQGTAERLRSRAASQEGVTADAGMKVADTMERTAGYLREHDTEEIVEDVEDYVRKHPLQAVAGAVIGGFIVGRILG